MSIHVLETSEEIKWLIDGIENGEIIIDSSDLTKEERERSDMEMTAFLTAHRARNCIADLKLAYA